MARFESVRSFLRLLPVLVAYPIAEQILRPVIASIYLRGGLALALTLLTLVLLDTVPAMARGQRPTFGEESFVYSGRGFLVLIAFVILVSALVDWFQLSFEFGEWALTAIMAVIAGTVVLASLVSYYWTQGQAAESE